jgi:glycosyltransferase involved in cell wall biosynthesis
MSEKNRVLNIVNRNALNGGVGTVLDSLVEGENASENYTGYTLTTTYDDKNQRPGPATLTQGRQPNNYVTKEGALENLMNKFDIIHVHGVPHYGILEAIYNLKTNERDRPKIVNTAHSSVKQEFEQRYRTAQESDNAEEIADFKELKFLKSNGILENPGRFADNYWGSAINRQEQIMSVSDIVQHMNRAYRTEIIQEFGAYENSGKHIVIPNGVKKIKNPTLRSKDKRLLYVGRFSPEKGIDELVDAVPEILINNPDAEIRFAGGDREGKLVKQYEERLEGKMRSQFPLMESDQVKEHLERAKFLGWISDKNELDKQYEWTDYVINPSACESFCLTAAEALMHKRIPILTSTPALDDLYISKGIALGIQENDRNPSGIASTVNGILERDNDPELDELVNRGRRYAATYYSDKAMVKKQLALFDKLLAA